MNILLIGGAKTERISEALEKCFSTGSATFLCEKGIDNFERFYDAGYYFERGVIIDYGIAFGHSSYDIKDNRERLNKFLESIQKRSRSTPKLVFICGTESMAEMVNQEIQVLSGYATVLFVKPPYSVTFMVEAASSQFEELYRYSYEAWLKQKEAEEQQAEAEAEEQLGTEEPGIGVGSEFGDIPVDDEVPVEAGEHDGLGGLGIEDESEQLGYFEVTDADELFGNGEPGEQGEAGDGAQEMPGDFEVEPSEPEDSGDWAGMSGQSQAEPELSQEEIPVEAEEPLEVHNEFPEEQPATEGDASDLFGETVGVEHESQAGAEGLFTPQPEQVAPTFETTPEPEQFVPRTPPFVAPPMKEKRKLFGGGKKQTEPKVRQPKVPVIQTKRGSNSRNAGANAEETLRAVMNTYKLRGHLITVTGAGGTGKTTIVNSLADLISTMGYSVLMVDFDVYHRGLSYNSLENYEAVHALDTGRSQLIEALKTGVPIQSVASIVKPGKHLLSSGLASDLSDKIFEPEQVSRLSSGSKGQYQVILVDVPWDLLVGPCSKLLYNSDDLVITADFSAAGLMELMLNMGNIPNEEMAQLLWTTSKLCLTKVGETQMINLGGARANGADSALMLLDKQLASILGEEAEYSFRRLHRTSEVTYDPRYKEMVMGKQLPSSIPEIRGTYMRLLESIITNA